MLRAASVEDESEILDKSPGVGCGPLFGIAAVSRDEGDVLEVTFMVTFGEQIGDGGQGKRRSHRRNLAFLPLDNLKAGARRGRAYLEDSSASFTE